MAMLIWMSWSGCKTARVQVIPADRTETFVKAGDRITVTNDAILMGLEQYQRYRRAVADRIKEEQQKGQK